MPEYFSAKEKKMYNKIKGSLGDNPRAEEIAARTVNKYRKKHGLTKDAKKSFDNEILNVCMAEVLGEIEKGFGIPVDEEIAVTAEGTEVPMTETKKSFADYFSDNDLQKGADNPRMAEQSSGYESSNEMASSGQAPRSALGEKTVHYNPDQSERTQDGGTKEGKADYSRAGNEGSNKPAGGFAPRSAIGAKTVQYNPHQAPNTIEKGKVVLPPIREGRSVSLMDMTEGNDKAVSKAIEDDKTAPVPSRNLQLEGEHNRNQR